MRNPAPTASNLPTPTFAIRASADLPIEPGSGARPSHDEDVARAAIAGRTGPSAPLPFHAALPLRAGSMRCGELIDLYMAHYAGRDSTRVQRLTWWQNQIGSIALQDLSDDHVHAALKALAAPHIAIIA